MFILYVWRIVLIDRYQVLLILGLMLSRGTLMTTTRPSSKLFQKGCNSPSMVVHWVFNKPFGVCGCRRTAKSTRCLNLGSYNYLGFGSFDEYCTPRVIESLKKFSPSTCSSRVDAGSVSNNLSLLCLLLPDIRFFLCLPNQEPHLCTQSLKNVLPSMWENLLLLSLAWASLLTLLSFLSWLERYLRMLVMK